MWHDDSHQNKDLIFQSKVALAMNASKSGLWITLKFDRFRLKLVVFAYSYMQAFW